MAKIHVLTAGSNNQYSVVVHVATPAGNNSAGIAWTAVALASGLNVTTMSIGVGSGQITQAEADSIAAGTTLEVASTFWDDVTLNTTQRLAALDALATAISTQLLSDYQAKYKYFGLTRT